MCEEMGIDSTGISADTPRATLRRMLDEKPMTLEEYGRRLRLQSSKLARLYSTYRTMVVDQSRVKEADEIDNGELVSELNAGPR